MKSMRMHKPIAISLLLLASIVSSAEAQADDEGEAQAGAGSPLAERLDAGLILGAKIGAGLGKPISDFGATPIFELELGYALPPLDRAIELFLSGQYMQPGIEDEASEADPRLPGDGIVHYEVTQQALTLSLGAQYHLDIDSDLLMPYAGIGGRMYMLRTKVKGEVDGESYGDNDETKTGFGLMLAFGLDIFVGPGALLAELQFGWGPLDAYVMRDTSMGALSLAVGYRFMI